MAIAVEFIRLRLLSQAVPPGNPGIGNGPNNPWMCGGPGTLYPNGSVACSGLQAWADALATVLLLELVVLLMILTALVAVLVIAARWTQMHMVPLLNMTVPTARHALAVTNESSDRVIRGVAEVHGIRRGLETALQILLFGETRIKPEPEAPAMSNTELPETRITARDEINAGATGRPTARPVYPPVVRPAPRDVRDDEPPRATDGPYTSMTPNAG